MAKGGASPGTKYAVNLGSGDDHFDGFTLDPAIQARGLIVNGNAGNDVLKGGSGQDSLNGGDGADYVYGRLDDLVGLKDGAIAWDGGRGVDTLDLSQLAYADGKGIEVRFNTTGRGFSEVKLDIDKDDAA